VSHQTQGEVLKLREMEVAGQEEVELLPEEVEHQEVEDLLWMTLEEDGTPLVVEGPLEEDHLEKFLVRMEEDLWEVEPS